MRHRYGRLCRALPILLVALVVFVFCYVAPKLNSDFPEGLSAVGFDGMVGCQILMAICLLSALMTSRK
ncbi:hypothetical protein [Kozakia baliensis]|uniref:hypothetical protein n=1 Tax=Kozakia baliensis TaxID=153496 RepID=UPI000879C375|nr:hypothetical protein [Kozakia baliensis]AOX21470.1 hypothetical protein A0U90_13255 [Kozakia baliensis]